MAVVLLSTSLVIGLGMGLTTLTVKGRSNPFENEGGRINPTEASKVLYDVIKTSKASEKLFRTKLADSLKNLFIVKQASQGMPEEQSKKIKEQIEVAANELKKRHQEELAISNITSRSELQQDELIGTKLDKVLSDLNSEDSQEEPSEISKIQTLQQNMVTPVPLEASSQQTPVETNTSTINQETNRTNLRNSVKKINRGTASAAEKAKVNDIVKLDNKIQNIQTKIKVIAREIKRRNTLPVPTPQSGPVQPSFQVQPQVAPIQLPIQVQVKATGGGGGDGDTGELKKLSEQLKELQNKFVAEKNALQQQLTGSIAQAAQAQANASLAVQKAQADRNAAVAQAQADANGKAREYQQEKLLLVEERDEARAAKESEAAQRQTLAADLAGKEALLLQAQQDLVTQQSAITQATTELATAKAVEGEMRKQLGQAKTNLNGAKTDLQGAQLQIKKKEGNITALQDIQAKITAQKEELRSKAERLEAEAESERTRANLLQVSVAKKEAEIQQKNQALSQQEALTQSQKESLEQQLSSSEAEKARLVSEKTLLDTAVIKKLEEINAMGSKIDEINAKLDQLNLTLQTEIREKEKLMTELERAKSNVESSRQSKEKAEIELQKAKNDLDTAKEELQAAKSTLKNYESKERQKNSELITLRAQAAQNTDGKRQISAKIAELEAKLRQMETESQDLRANLAQKDGEIQGLQEELTQKDREIQEIKAQLTQKDGEIKGLKEVAFPATSPRSPRSPGRQTPLDKTITTLQEKGVDDVKIQSKYLVPILKIFCENLQKVLDPRLVRRYASISNLAYSNNKSFEEATFDYRGVCVACAHTVSIVTDFIESIINPDNINNPFHELPGPGFYDDIENTGGGGVLTWKTSNYIRGILFSTKLTRTRDFHKKLWTSGQKDRATSKLAAVSAERTPLQHWQNRQIPYLTDSPDVNPRGANLLSADSAARLQTHQAGIFGRLSAKGRTPGYLIGQDIRISSSKMELGIKEKTTANQVGPSIKQVTVSDAINTLANKMIEFARGTSVKYENVIDFMIKSNESFNVYQNQIVEKMKQLSVTRELPYLMRVFDTKLFDESQLPLDGILEKQELTRLMDHVYGRSSIESDKKHTFLRYDTYKRYAKPNTFPKYSKYVDFDIPSEKSVKEAEDGHFQSQVDNIADKFGRVEASDGGPSAPQRQLSAR